MFGNAIGGRSVALVKRASDLDMITSRKARTLYMRLRKAGYATKEPVELDPPTETPEQFPKLLRYFTEKLEYTNADLQHALAVGSDILDSWISESKSTDAPYLKLVK